MKFCLPLIIKDTIIPCLLRLRKGSLGKKNGTVSSPHVECADDLCFLTESKDELQGMVGTSEKYANREHYTFHPTKTVVVPYNTSDTPTVTLYEREVPVEDKTLHLGIHRSTDCTSNIDEKINLGRRTAYSLMSAGFHDKTGIKQSLKADMWRKYVMQRLIYGLEVQNLRKKDIQLLETFQIRCTKQLQRLPLKTLHSAALV